MTAYMSRIISVAIKRTQPNANLLYLDDSNSVLVEITSRTLVILILFLSKFNLGLDQSLIELRIGLI